MIFPIERLITDVMASLGENPGPQCLLPGLSDDSRPSGGEGIPWPQDVIALKVRSLLPEVGSRLIREAPSDMQASPSGGSVISYCVMRLMPCGLYGAEIRLPDDFLRLVSVRMSEWGRSVSRLVTPDLPEWCRQWSHHPGIAGCQNRPAAYLDRDSGGLILRLLGTQSEDATLDHLHLWNIPTLSTEGTFDFPAPLYPSLVAAIHKDLYMAFDS